VIRSVVMTGSPGEDCQIAAFRFAEDRRTLILVSHRWKGTPACKTNDFVDTWARTVAFDTQQRQVWNTRTCDAGHYAWPLDENFDGWAEGVFVGKYLLSPHGQIKCVLGTWPQRDHVDSLAVADLDLRRPGLEAVAVGRTGLAMFDPTDCKQIWRIAGTVIRDPQHVAVAKLDPSSNVPQIVVDERGSIRNPRTFVISGQGKIMASSKTLVMPMQNANLDGALGVDEKVGNFGRVIDRWGNLRLSRAWYWNLKGSRVTETANGPYPLNYDRWQGFPLVFDYDRDGRDEIVTWGQSLIVVGKVVPMTPWQPVLKLRSAVLGGAQTCDALPVLARRCDGRLTCAAYVSGMLCPTPQPGTARKLQVQYTCGGILKVATFNQGAAVRLSCLAP
jgi:hypothetical protein